MFPHSRPYHLEPRTYAIGGLFRALAELGLQLVSGENTVRSLREQPGQAAAALDAVANLSRIAERLNDHLHTLNDRL